MLFSWLNTLFLLQSCKQLTFKCFILILSILFLRVALTHCTDMIAIQFFFWGPQVSAKAPGGPRVAQFVGPPTASVASRHLRRCGPCGIRVSRHGKHGKENRKDPLLLGPSVPLMYVPKKQDYLQFVWSAEGESSNVKFVRGLGSISSIIESDGLHHQAVGRWSFL